MKYKIEENVKVPKGKIEQTELGQVILKMKPGDSIVVETFSERNAFAAYCAKLNYAYTTRRLIDKESYRCWLKSNQDLTAQRKKKISTKKDELLGDDEFLSKGALGISYTTHDEVCEPRGNISAEVLTEAIQKSNEFKFSYNRMSEFPEDRNDFTKHDSKGDLRPLDFDD